MLGAVLLLASGLTVATVVRLALHARRDEVDIMHLMGAPMSLLRGPLVVEGFLQGGLGAALALALLYAAFEIARAQFAPSLSGLIDTASLGFLPASLSALLVVGGMGVGCLGGLIAARHVR
ncbi:MAG: hypothetical protein NTY02_17945 [Acidobacteria bacterium]|nr:hypothetical protein [Acidobacteriota bacterium]